MDWESQKINAESAAVRSRGWFSLLIRLSGIALLVVAAVNMILLGTEPIFPIYRQVFFDLIGASSTGGYILADFVAMAVGAAVAHFV